MEICLIWRCVLVVFMQTSGMAGRGGVEGDDGGDGEKEGNIETEEDVYAAALADESPSGEPRGDSPVSDETDGDVYAAALADESPSGEPSDGDVYATGEKDNVEKLCTGISDGDADGLADTFTT